MVSFIRSYFVLYFVYISIYLTYIYIYVTYIYFYGAQRNNPTDGGPDFNNM